MMRSFSNGLKNLDKGKIFQSIKYFLFQSLQEIGFIARHEFRMRYFD
jgi:hypothetical protein